MMQGFESVEHELDAKRLQLEQELEAARGHASAIEADLERVHEALAALTGHKKKAKRSRSSRKPASSVRDLQGHIAKVREDDPFADAKQLEKAVRAMVKASGSSLANFKAVFAEALLTSPGSHVNAHAGSGSAHHGHSQGAPHADHGDHVHADEEHYSN